MGCVQRGMSEWKSVSNKGSMSVRTWTVTVLNRCNTWMKSWSSLFKPSRPCVFVIHSLQELRESLSQFWFTSHTVCSTATLWVIIVSWETNAIEIRKHHSEGGNCLKDIASNAGLDQLPFCFQITELLNRQLFSIFWLHTVSGFTFMFIFCIVVVLLSGVWTCFHGYWTKFVCTWTNNLKTIFFLSTSVFSFSFSIFCFNFFQSYYWFLVLLILKLVS